MLQQLVWVERRSVYLLSSQLFRRRDGQRVVLARRAGPRGKEVA